MAFKLSIWKQLLKWMLGAFTWEFEPGSWIHMSLHSYLKWLFKAIICYMFDGPNGTPEHGPFNAKAWHCMKKMITLKSLFRYEWSDMSIQLPGSNSQVKAPSIHLKSCFHFDNFNRYWFHIVVRLLDYLKLWNSNHDAQRVRETFTFEVTIHMSFTLHCCMNHLRIL